MMKKLWLIDWKSAKGIWDENYIQASCYYHMAKQIDIEAQGVGILRLDKETGMPEFADCTKDLEMNWSAFLSLREYYRVKIEAFKEPKKGYRLNGKMLPSITEILSILNKPALTQWSANETVAYLRDALPELRTEDITDDRIEYIFKKAKTAYREISKKAMDTGTIVHDAIECYLSGGKPEDILGNNDKATNAFLAFLEWRDKVELEPIALEKELIDSEHEIGGTVDFIGKANIE